ncbi:hypothetical protein [uncultured Pyramidobacter sp.]|uniref:hypothetical protein n=1 Tax=uncultured Pyramidobacter sp. TaxID=1623495 RepID=UPI00258C8102|nr:hypothetical protein [uncultured Pyramidobacter sp.]
MTAGKTHTVAVELSAGVYERLVVWCLKETGSIRGVGKAAALAVGRYLDAQDMRSKLEGRK